MVSNMSGSSSAYFPMLQQPEQHFWSSTAHLSEGQQQHPWLQDAPSLPSNAFYATQPSMAQQIPRTLPYNTPTSDLEIMNRVRSAPSMACSQSNMGLDSNDLQRCSTTYSDWESMSQNATSNYALCPTASVQTQTALQPISEGSCYSTSMIEYSPGEYITNCIEPTSSAPLCIPNPQPSEQWQGQLTPNQWSTSSECSTSPSTSPIALLTPVTQSSNGMSRQGSRNFLDNVSMLRLHSDSSFLRPIPSEDGVFPYPVDAQSKPISSDADGSHFLGFTGPSSEAFLSSSTNHVSASAPVLVSFDNEQSYLVEDMQRSASASSGEGNASDASAQSSAYSRQLRREREINAQAASRKIAPKAIDLDDEAESTPSSGQMAQIRHEDGSSKTVGLLTKTPYVRPAHPKIPCPHCSERAEGFRGTHELERHVARAHAPTRKGFICVDFSSDKKFLANCKHCRNKKVYGAYYNAAAHLRRAHFNPRKRGRKGKNDEKRGGIGGGDKPAMDILKQHWIREVEVNKSSPQSPESASDDGIDLVDNSLHAPYDLDTSITYPSSQQSMSVPMASQLPVGPNQYIEYNMSMPSSESMMMYDSTTFAAFDPNITTSGDISNFEFDAYARN